MCCCGTRHDHRCSTRELRRAISSSPRNRCCLSSTTGSTIYCSLSINLVAGAVFARTHARNFSAAFAAAFVNTHRAQKCCETWSPHKEDCCYGCSARASSKNKRLVTERMAANSARVELPAHPKHILPNCCIKVHFVGHTLIHTLMSDMTRDKRRNSCAGNCHLPLCKTLTTVRFHRNAALQTQPTGVLKNHRQQPLALWPNIPKCTHTQV